MTGLKRLKDIDVAARTHFIRVYCWLLFPLLFIMLWVPVGFAAKILISLAGALAGTVIVVVFTGLAGRSAGMLYSGGGARVGLREQLEAELTRVRVSKTEKRYADAMALLESILARDPDFTEALLLKAQVLWEGYGEAQQAREILMRILHLEQDRSTPVYRWAGELYKVIGKS